MSKKNFKKIYKINDINIPEKRNNDPRTTTQTNYEVQLASSPQCIWLLKNNKFLSLSTVMKKLIDDD